jgi:hypothetical protein
MRVDLVASHVPLPSARRIAVIRQVPDRKSPFCTSCQARDSGMPVAASISLHTTTSGKSAGVSVTVLQRWDIG